MKHLIKCIQALNDTKAIKCPHSLPWCPTSFESAQKRRFHLQDVHCIEFSKEIKRGRSNNETETKAKNDIARIKRHRRTNSVDAREATSPELKFMFINENVKIFQPKARDSTASGSSPCAVNFLAEQEQSISH